MRRTSRLIASASVGGLMLLGTSAFGGEHRPGRGPAPAVRQWAGRSGLVAGVVLDERGRPVSGAEVSAVGATKLTTTTDQSGRFEFRSVPEGSYVVRARLEGWGAAAPRLISVASGIRPAPLVLRR